MRIAKCTKRRMRLVLSLKSSSISYVDQHCAKTDYIWPRLTAFYGFICVGLQIIQNGHGSSVENNNSFVLQGLRSQAAIDFVTNKRGTANYKLLQWLACMRNN
ncbi:hypothetical protein MKW98_028579 [Papaver atlanticum]|uniref:Uncharacterized protein n=1 Tax=Papaver atlanticum TaxID=357466 RepID=A0AAD4XSJ1_9MAGN|nr:hypothetical protein MKW98_028579 [Papaver atlanticum]